MTKSEAKNSKYSNMSKADLINLLEVKDENDSLKDTFSSSAALLTNQSAVNSDAPLYYRGKERLPLDKIHPVRLVPIPSQSFNAEEFGGNKIISGENLKVMSSLLVDYRGQIDVIYIDPPYNTGGEEFPYNDSFNLTREQLKNLPRLVKEKTSIVSSEDANKHTKWVSHMAYRLFMARKLLSLTGVIAVSIDEHELPRLWLLMSEIFGENNRLATIIWEKSRKNDVSYISEGHEYILLWARDKQSLESIKKKRGKWREEKLGNGRFLDYFYGLIEECGDDYKAISDHLKKYVAEAKRGEALWTLRQYTNVDENSKLLGPYKEEDPSWPGGGGKKFPLIYKETGEAVKIPPKGWIWSSEEDAQKAIDSNLIIWKRSRNGQLGIPKIKKYLLEGRDKEVFTSVQRKEARGSVMALKSIFGEDNELFGKTGAFPNPKDHELLARIFSLVTWGKPNAVFLDPYAGSGTTAHAVLSLNERDQGDRKFILIEAGLTAKKFPISGHDYTDRITAERVRRVISGHWSESVKKGLNGGFTFYHADSKSISRKDILQSDRERLSDIILQITEDDSNRVDCRMKGRQYLIGKTRKSYGIALVWGEGTGGSILTSEKLRTIHAEAQEASLSMPYHVYATANEAAHNDGIYQFHQIPDAILAKLGIEDNDE